MSDFAQLMAEAPELGARVRAAFAVAKHATMASLRRDGGPRISGTEVEFDDDGSMCLGMMAGSRKGADLLRDDRVAVHSPTRDPETPTTWAGEAKLSGRAVPVPVPDGYPEGAMRFRIDLDSAVFTGLTAAGEALRIELWRPGRAVEVITRS